VRESIYTSGSYGSLHPTWHAEDSPWKARQIYRILQQYDIHPKEIAEVGCGAGVILSELQQLLPSTCEFRGYDIAPQAIAVAKQRENDRLRFDVANIDQLKSSHVDVLLLIDVIEHVEDYFSLLRIAKEIADYTVLHIPLDIHLQSVLRVTPITDTITNVGHLHHFTRETALILLEQAGFQIRGWNYTADAVELPNTERRTRLARVPRRAAFAVAPDLAVRVLGGYSLMVLVT